MILTSSAVAPASRAPALARRCRKAGVLTPPKRLTSAPYLSRWFTRAMQSIFACTNHQLRVTNHRSKGRNSQSTFAMPNSLKTNARSQPRAEHPGACQTRNSQPPFRPLSLSPGRAGSQPRFQCGLPVWGGSPPKRSPYARRLSHRFRFNRSAAVFRAFCVPTI